MRLEDIHPFTETGRPKASLYWIGSRQALSKGKYDRLRPVYVLAVGHFTEYRGECGSAVMETPAAPNRLVVATHARHRYSYGNYYDNEWEPRVITPAAVLISDRELRERIKLQKADAKRHDAARKAIQARRDELGTIITKELLNGTAKFADPAAPDSLGWRAADVEDPTIRIMVKAKASELRKTLSPMGVKAMEELVKLKDPAC